MKEITFKKGKNRGKIVIIQIEIYKITRSTQKFTNVLELVSYSNHWYEIYKEICCSSFYEVSMQTNQDPFVIYSPNDLFNSSNKIYLHIHNNELIGATEIDSNEFKYIFVNNKFKQRGFGTNILTFSINQMYLNGYSENIC